MGKKNNRTLDAIDALIRELQDRADLHNQAEEITAEAAKEREIGKRAAYADAAERLMQLRNRRWRDQ